MRIHFFINRPILSIVISLIIALCGLVAAFNMPVDEYPNITPPSLSISAHYPGASAQTAERTIAAQLEAKLNGVSSLLYMSSNSTSTGSISIHLVFEVGTNLNSVVNEVLNRVHAAMPLLPSIVQALGVTVRKNSPDMLMVINFSDDGSGKFDLRYFSNYLHRTLYNDLAIIPGVGAVGLYGDTYAMRVWLNVNKMNELNITANDIANAIREQSHEYSIGMSNAMPSVNALLSFNIAGGEMYSEPLKFANIIVRQTGSEIIRVKDVAKVELAAQSYDVRAFSQFYQDWPQHKHLTDRELVAIPIYLDGSANELAVRTLVLNKLAKEAKNFPQGLQYHVMFDATQFISASITNVKEALFAAFFLVALIILLFLHDYKASIIALLTIPVSILGAFMCLKVLGLSINTLSLFAMILAIGIVVDDAIVVIENVERLKKTHDNLSIKQVIELAIHEVLGAIIAIALVLSVVFIPVMTLSGLSGVLYRQFAITIACTVVISAITAITLTPAISGLLLKGHGNTSKFAQVFDRWLNGFTNLYLRLATKVINWGKYSVFGFILALVVVIVLAKFIPMSFVPNEDQGYFFASINLPPSSSLAQTKTVAAQVARQISSHAGVREVLQIDGIDFFGGGVNSYAATLIILLENWQKRTHAGEGVEDIVNATNMLNARYKDLTIRAFNMPPIRGVGSTGGVEFYLEDRAVGNIKKLDQIATELDKNLMKHKEIKNAYHLLDSNTEQLQVTADINRAKFYHVNINEVYSTLQSIYSNYNVSFAYIMQGLIWVILEADYAYRKGLDNLHSIYVRSSITNTHQTTNTTKSDASSGNASNAINKGVSAELVPLNSLVKTSYYKAPQKIERFNDYPATQVIVMPNAGYTSGQIMQIISDEVSKLPTGYNEEWFGASYMQNKASHNSLLAFSFSLIMIYLVLCALYEMWRLPLVVLMGIPFALLGSAIMLILRQQPNDLYFQISLITLLGLSAKNIILLIEFALKHFNHGNSAKESALYALKVRFRPILMTSITFIVGSLPLVFAKGAGANAMHSVGTGIIGGMIGSILLGTLFTPSYFVLIMQNFKRKQDSQIE